VPASFSFAIPSFAEAEREENAEIAQFNTENKTQIELTDIHNDTAEVKNEEDSDLDAHSEEDEKMAEISDVHRQSTTLAEVIANQSVLSCPFSDSSHSEQEMDADILIQHKPLQRRSQKRKLTEIQPIAISDIDDEPSLAENRPIQRKKKRRISKGSDTLSGSPSKKRSLSQTSFADDSTTSSPMKKRRVDISAAKTPSPRNIGLNEAQIDDSLSHLNSLENDLAEDNILLQNNLSTARRSSETVTSEMVDECRALLDLFGVPYITSPSEAEAQCAELNRLGLVDGIVTDDSDVFLFGGATIYKNMFHLKKYVERFTASQLSAKLGLSRHRLISLAMLLGSDYTDGIKGIGPVNGMEIVQTFCAQRNGFCGVGRLQRMGLFDRARAETDEEGGSEHRRRGLRRVFAFEAAMV